MPVDDACKQRLYATSVDDAGKERLETALRKRRLEMDFGVAFLADSPDGGYIRFGLGRDVIVSCHGRAQIVGQSLAAGAQGPPKLMPSRALSR